MKTEKMKIAFISATNKNCVKNDKIVKGKRIINELLKMGGKNKFHLTGSTNRIHYYYIDFKGVIQMSETLNEEYDIYDIDVYLREKKLKRILL